MELNKHYLVCIKYDHDDTVEQQDMGILIKVVKTNDPMTILKFDKDGYIYNWYCPSRKIQKWIIKE